MGKEYQSWNSEENLQSENHNVTHWIEFNGKKEIIFRGSKRDTNCHEIYFNKLIELIDEALKASNKQERVFQITAYDGIFICLLTEKQYSLLKEICKPLRNSFIK